MEIDCNALIQKAANLIYKGKNLDEAKSILNTLLTLLIDDSNLNYHIIAMLADLEYKAGNKGLSLILNQHALTLKPDYCPSINNIGVIYKSLGDRQKALEAFDKLLPYLEDESLTFDDECKASYLISVTSSYIANGTPDIAINMLDKVLELAPNNQEALWNRGLAYLEKGDYERGFLEVENGARIERERHRKYAGIDVPYWDGTPNQTVVVFGEQGLGDEIMFASMIPDLIKDCKEVIIDGHIRLINLFQESFPGISVYGTREGKDVPWSYYHKIDAKISIGSLGKFYRKKKEDFPGTPYIKPNEKLVAKYREKLNALGDKPKIGISWKGGTALTNEKVRKIELNQLIPILRLRDKFDFISLQYHQDTEKELNKFYDKYSYKVHHWKDTIDNYDHTAALVSCLDMVISIPQSVVHLAGSMGVKTYQLCPKQAMWQMGPYGEDMPWYDCVKNIWQSEAGNWEEVILKMEKILWSI